MMPKPSGNSNKDSYEFKKALEDVGKNDITDLIKKLQLLLPDEKISIEENNDHEVDEEGGMAKSQLKAIAAYANAISDFTKALEIDPDNTNAYFRRGVTKTKMQEYSAVLLG